MKQTRTFRATSGSHETNTNTSGDLGFTWNRQNTYGYLGFAINRHEPFGRPQVSMKQTQTHLGTSGSREKDTNTSGDSGFTWNRHKFIWGPRLYMEKTQTHPATTVKWTQLVTSDLKFEKHARQLFRNEWRPKLPYNLEPRVQQRSMLIQYHEVKGGVSYNLTLPKVYIILVPTRNLKSTCLYKMYRKLFPRWSISKLNL